MASDPECFVIMPVTDPDGYESGHFSRVYEDILSPACRMAGYSPIRADQVRETNLIHLDVLQRLLESPMVLCDLSSRNPNVLFELGLRQAFDKPVVLVQEFGTPRIFDIAPLRYTEYRRGRIYHEVLQDQESIAQAIKSTRGAFDKGAGVNSIVRILSLTKPAAIPEVQDAQRDPILQIIRAELSELRNEFRRGLRQGADRTFQESFVAEIDELGLALSGLAERLERMEESGEIDKSFSRVLDRASEYRDKLIGKAAAVPHLAPRYTTDEYGAILRDLRRRYEELVLKNTKGNSSGA